MMIDNQLIFNTSVQGVQDGRKVVNNDDQATPMSPGLASPDSNLTNELEDERLMFDASAHQSL